MALPFNRVRRGATNHIALTPEYFVSPSDVGMAGLKTRCLLQAVDGGSRGSNREVSSPRSAAQRSKGQHEMPISYDNPDAHAFWHCVHLEMFSGLPVVVVFILYHTFLSPRRHPFLLIYLHVILQILWFFTKFIFTFLLFQGISCLCVLRPSFYYLPPFALRLLCIRSSFSVRHKNNRLFLTTAFFLSDFIAHIRRGN